MKTISITENYKPAVAYTDYVFTYRAVKGSVHRVLKLFTFCRKIESGESIKIGDKTFVASAQFLSSLKK